MAAPQSKNELLLLKNDQLKTRLKALNMQQGGAKTLLVERLYAAERVFEHEYDSEEEDVNQWSSNEIWRRMEERGLIRTGGHATLVARIQLDHDRRKGLWDDWESDSDDSEVTIDPLSDDDGDDDGGDDGDEDGDDDNDGGDDNNDDAGPPNNAMSNILIGSPSTPSISPKAEPVVHNNDANASLDMFQINVMVQGGTTTAAAAGSEEANDFIAFSDSNISSTNSETSASGSLYSDSTDNGDDDDEDMMDVGKEKEEEDGASSSSLSSDHSRKRGADEADLDDSSSEKRSSKRSRPIKEAKKTGGDRAQNDEW
ncbi:hypothetical protein UCREL1_11689 [Eutypa lata UCREL1]|uniref:SAP domain-containing protein n=1 Tax=Eutypa lata (strain UCR-EL1) TaxID=1287681 RepID=M7SUW0_EUTLA|nr:hypothetical protein UCREL1_11689 [Eutypa lata UCREL1]